MVKQFLIAVICNVLAFTAVVTTDHSANAAACTDASYNYYDVTKLEVLAVEDIAINNGDASQFISSGDHCMSHSVFVIAVTVPFFFGFKQTHQIDELQSLVVNTIPGILRPPIHSV